MRCEQFWLLGKTLPEPDKVINIKAPILVAINHVNVKQ